MNLALRGLAIATLSFVLFNLSLYSQEPEQAQDNSSFKRNAIYGSFGFGIAYISYSGYYERIIGRGINNEKIEAFIRGGIVGGHGWVGGVNLSAEFGLLFGQGNSHLELAAGWHPIIDKWNDFGPVGGSIAYRYQKADGNFIFRAGLGFPEALFISVGFCF